MKHLWEDRLLTVPNLLSVFRLGLIPPLCRLAAADDTSGAALVLLLSGLTDALDGPIARRFGQVSDLGKALDPLADKLTQLAAGLCLVRRQPLFLPLCAELAVKELIVARAHLRAVRASGRVSGAQWHGKLAAAALFVTMALHFLWTGIPGSVSGALVSGCMGAALLSGALYTARFRQLAKG